MQINDFNKVTTSAKLVEKGDLFIDYNINIKDVYEAIGKGAKAVVTQLKIGEIPQNIHYFKISNLRNNISSFLSELYDYPSKKLKIIGITGTNGKTSTTSFLFHILNSFKYPSSIFSTIASRLNNNVFTTPLSYAVSVYIHGLLALLIKRECKYCCLEVTSIAMDTGHLNAVHFCGAIFTNLTHDHLDYHGNMEEYFKAKKKLFDGLSSETFALVNKDDSYSEAIIADCKAKKYTFSLENFQADFYAKLIKESSNGIVLEIEGKQWQFPLKGRFNAYNLLGAYGAAVLLGENKEKILQALQSAEAPTGRLQPIENNNGIHAFVDYAHTPDGLEKVLATVGNMKKDNAKVIVVAGCGGNKDKEKRSIMGKIAVQNSDIAIFTSDNPRDEDPIEIIKAMMGDLTEQEMQLLEIEPDRKAAIQKACELAKAGDIILVAGKGHEETQEINGEKLYFSDQEVLKKLLNKM
jgi:UDP-N-acetylmuramoyl-L-alanyl-D-glutamate--2,6-diaminopimelate ligase